MCKKPTATTSMSLNMTYINKVIDFNMFYFLCLVKIYLNINFGVIKELKLIRLILRKSTWAGFLFILSKSKWAGFLFILSKSTWAGFLFILSKSNWAGFLFSNISYLYYCICI